ncbi:MAG: HAD-IA family hydrolase [Alphaproteobacteria bacterium]|nr:HAD-IA family hydrolase [Alphaproteobacteria bacterium]
MPRILVLDLDGVVVRGHPGGGRWDKHLERDLGIPPDRLQAHFFKPHWPRIVTGTVDMMEVLHAVWPALGAPAAPEDLVAYWFAADSRIDPDVLAAVAAWRGAGRRAFLATVQEHRRARYLMHDLNLVAHFDAMLYSADLGAAKPDPAFYTRAQARLPAASPGEVIFLDDQSANVEAARAFGWRARPYTAIADLHAALAEP